MLCPLCLGRFGLRPLSCGHFLCSHCILSAPFRQCIPTEAERLTECVNCHQKIGFRHIPTTMAFARNSKEGRNGKVGTIHPSIPPLYSLTFARLGCPTKGSDAGEHQQRTTALGMRTLRRSRIFPTMEKRTNGSAAVKQLCTAGKGTDQSATTAAARHINCTIRRVGPFSAPIHSLHHKNSWSDDERGEFDKGRAFFAALVGRFDAALNSLTAAAQPKGTNERKSVDLLLSAKESLCKSERRIWRERTQPTNGRPWTDRCHRRGFDQRNNDRSADREIAVVRTMRELVVSMEEYNRRECCHQMDGQSANVWRRKAGLATIQMLALSVLLVVNCGICEKNLVLLKRHISLVGMRMNGRENEQKAEEVLDALLICSGQINATLGRSREMRFPSHLISTIAHVQFVLFEAMDQITQQQILELKTEKRKKVWQMVTRCFGELFQIENMNSKSNEFPWKRFTLIAHLAKFLHLFADICDTPTQMLCIIEVEKARAFAAEESAMSGELRATVSEQLTRIELELAECQRVQKWNELKLGTQIIRRRDGREMGGGQNERRSAKMREWAQRVLLGGRKFTQKMLGRRNGWRKRI
ncbi:hypothetical protein niasHT_015508 [Heterodera trifolii]|uniref:RING-type domain-containing protein n=1 Tax=Heterodera trifolii TaxID=157864 RepID=A0ABD2L094_9BILA